MAPSNDAIAFKNLVSKSRSIIAVSGAGLSAASGIPTFRGAGGYWKRYNAISLATPEAFSANPSRVWQFYHMRRRVALESLPNAAHYTLADLCIPERLHSIASDAEFTSITQNVDGLSIRALKEKLTDASEATKPYPVYEMHGRVLDTLCTVCNHKEYNDTHPLCEALGKADEQDKLFPHLETDIPTDELPTCRRCGGIQRPGVVWFGERPVFLKEIDEAVAKADLCLVVGTSSTVYPAAGYASEVAQNGGKVAIFNLERSDGDDEADFLFLGPCEETLPSMLFG